MLIDDLSKRGILIVDDERTMVMVMERVLTERGYKRVFTANNGTEAVSILASRGEEIYLVLLDLRMPGIDGFGVMKHLANVHSYPVGIVLVTAYGSSEVKEEFFRCGTETVIPLDYITKPFDIKEMLSDVEKTLNTVHDKRLEQLDISSKELYRRIYNLDSRIATVADALFEVKSELRELSKKQHGLLAELGMELIKAIVIALAVIALVYLGVGDLVRNIIHRIP